MNGNIENRPENKKNCENLSIFIQSRPYSAALCGCGETRAERKLLRAIGDCGQKVERGKDPDLRTGCGLSVVSVDGKKTRPGGNVAEHFL